MLKHSSFHVWQKKACLFVAFVVSLATCGKKKEDKEPSVISIANGTQDLSTASAGKLVFGATRTLTLTITNSGEQDATLGALTVKNSAGNEVSNYDFTGGEFPGTGGTCTTALGSGGSCTISVTFTDPTAETFASADYEATATLVYSDESGSYEKTFAVGIILPAFLSVKYQTRKLTTYDFGGRSFGDTRSATLMLTNSGELAASVSSLAFKDSTGTALSAYSYTGGTFPGTGGTCTASIAAGASCSIAITFTAPSATAYAATAYAGTATVTYNNGVQAKTTTFSVTGTATQCADGSGLALEQYTYDAGSASAATSETHLAAQSFSFPERRLIKKIRLSQYKGVGATFTGVRISFFAASGSSPATTATATYDFSDPGLVQSSRSYFTYTLSTPMTIEASSTYWMAISYPGLAGGIVYTDLRTIETESSGSYYYYNGTSWANTTTSELTFGIETCLVDTLAEPSVTYGD